MTTRLTWTEGAPGVYFAELDGTRYDVMTITNGDGAALLLVDGCALGRDFASVASAKAAARRRAAKTAEASRRLGRGRTEDGEPMDDAILELKAHNLLSRIDPIIDWEMPDDADELGRPIRLRTVVWARGWDYAEEMYPEVRRLVTAILTADEPPSDSTDDERRSIAEGDAETADYLDHENLADEPL